MLPWSQNFWISTIRGLANMAEKKEELNFLCTIALKNKAVALTFESQKFCFDGNVRSNFSYPYSSYIY